MIHRFHSLASTNSKMTEMASALFHGDVVICREQTAGRGQRGNSWEAEPDKNLTFSLLLKPQVVSPARSFLLSMAVSIGITDALKNILDTDIEIKWPNDIYWRDKKLAGILIENSFSGTRIDHSIIGIGLNVNQCVFISDAPNPVSMVQIAGREFVLDEVLDKIVDAIVSTFDSFENNPDETRLLRRYHSLLWRREGLHRWHDLLADELVDASVARVEASGHLVLATSPERRFAFKEIAAVL